MPTDSEKLSIIEVRLPQENEYTLESMSSLLSNFTQFSGLNFFEKLIGRKKTIASIEIVLHNGQIHFYVVTQTDDAEFFKSQILANTLPLFSETPPTIYCFCRDAPRASPNQRHTLRQQRRLQCVSTTSNSFHPAQPLPIC